MDPKTVLTTAQILPLLESLEGQLSGAIRTGVERLLPLFSAGKASLADGLNALCPDHDLANPGDRKDAFKQFQNLVARFGKIAAATGLAIRSDNFKRNEPADRHCWIEGPAPEASAIADFASEAISTLDSLPALVPPTAIILNPAELENRDRERPLIRFFVSYAHDNDELVSKLQQPLEKELRLSKRYRFEVWDDRKIPVGEHWDAAIKGALAEYHFGLLFVSREFLLSTYITREELPVFVSGKKPVIPVGLTVLDFARIDLKGLADHQIFRLTRTGEAPRFFAKCAGQMAEEFIRQLATKIEESVAGWLAAQESGIGDTKANRVSGKPHRRQPSVPSFSAPDLTEPDDADLVIQLNREIIRKTQRPACLVSPEAAATSFETLQRDTTQATENRTLAVDYLADWATDPAGAPFCAVLGELGIGKTTTLMMLAREMDRRRETDATVPAVIFIDLKDYELDAGAQLEDILAVVIRRHWKGEAGKRLTPEMIIRAVQEKGALLIFDGLDERIIPLPQAKREAFIRELWRALPPLTHKPRAGVRPGRLIISCRSHYFPKVTDLSTAFTGELREGIREKFYTACIILPFRDEQVRAYLRGVLCQEGDSEAACDAEVEKAVGIIRSVHNLTEASTRPFLLSLIAPELAELERMRAAGRTVLGVTLYALFVDKWLARDAGKHQFTPDHKRLMMEALAAHLCRENQKTLPWAKVSRWLDGFLAAHQEIRDRYQQPAEVLDQDFRAATLVLRPDSESDGFRFAHTSLYEYFLALHLARALEEGRPAEWDLPMPSDKTLDFFGQLLAEAQQVQPARVLAAWTALLDDPAAPAQARRAAFKAWLIAREKSLPVPPPRAAQLHGLDMEHWHIGTADGPVLDLCGANLEGTCLDHAVLTRVLLTGARADGASARLAEFQDVTLTNSSWEGADFTGGTWRDCTARGQQAATARWHDCDVIRCDLAGARLPADWQRHVAAALSPAHPTHPPAQPAFLRQGHVRTVNCVAWSPDGACLVSGSDDNTVKVWDAASGCCLLSLNGHTSEVRSVAWSSDGSGVVSGSLDATVRIWDVASGRCLRTLDGHKYGVLSVTWSPDGTHVVSGSCGETVKIWDVASGRCLLSLGGFKYGVQSMAWSPDGARVVSGSGRIVRMWDAADGRYLLAFAGHKKVVMSVAWSPDGARMASGSLDNTVKVWDAASGRCLLTLNGHKNSVSSVAWSPDGARVVSGSKDNSVKVWDAASGRCLLTLHGHKNSVRSVAWSPDGAQLVSGSEDDSVRAWDVVSGRTLLTIGGGRTNGVWSATWSPDGARVVSGSDDNSVKVWDAADGRCLLALAGHKNLVMSVAWSPDQTRVASGGYDCSVKLWDTASGRCLRSFDGHKDLVLSVAWSPDASRLVSGSDDKKVKIWDVAGGRCVRSLAAHKQSVVSVAWAPDGTRVASGSDDNTVKVWDVASGRCLLSCSGHNKPVMSVAWSRDSLRLVSGSDDHSVKVWGVARGRCIISLTGHKSLVRCVAWSPDGTRVVSGSWDQCIKVWDVASGRCLISLFGHECWVASVAWSPDGTRILSAGGDSTIREWDAATGQLLRTWLSKGAESALIDFPGNRILHASPGAWRHLGWQGYDPVSNRRRLLPAEYYGPLPAWPGCS